MGTSLENVLDETSKIIRIQVQVAWIIHYMAGFQLELIT